MNNQERKKITIEVEPNIESSIADILCYMAGLIDAKGEDWKNKWLQDSVDDVKKLKMQIAQELKKTEKYD